MLGTWESQVKVNCVEGLAFLEACCCRRLIFSWPLEGVIGLFSAFAFAVAIDLEIIPGDSAFFKLAKKTGFI